MVSTVKMFASMFVGHMFRVGFSCSPCAGGCSWDGPFFSPCSKTTSAKLTENTYLFLGVSVCMHG